MARRIQWLLHGTQRSLLWLLMATYVLGMFAPRAGLCIRDAHVPFGRGHGPAAPMLMLAFLLFVAGLGLRVDEVRHVVRRPRLLVASFALNVLYPLVITVALSGALSFWHNGDEAQSILVGLAIIGAMPIAGSSTAWSENADGNLALSLGLVWTSTLLSPLLTPIGLHAIGFVTKGDYSEDLIELAHQGASAFVALTVLVPSLVGIGVRALLGRERVGRVLPLLKLLNLANLLALNYSNAAVALPQVAASPDWDFLALVLAITGFVCAGAFVVGWWLPVRLGADRAERIAAMFGMGMNNNGTGLVLAGAALADHRLVLLPIIFYNLVQQLVAGVVDAVEHRRRAGRLLQVSPGSPAQATAHSPRGKEARK